MPRAYIAMIFSSSPSIRVWPLPIRRGSKLPSPIARHLDLERAVLALQRLAADPVPPVRLHRRAASPCS
ncbi:hypothetical protein CNY89_30290, partial [Amaricoccus sp. HAR-UPW-R2A-40]